LVEKETKKTILRILRIGVFAILAIILSYFIFRFSGVAISVITAYLETLESADRLVIYALATVVLGIGIAISLLQLYKRLVSWRIVEVNIKDVRRRLLIVSPGSICKLLLKNWNPYVSIPKEIKEDYFESRCVLLAYNPDEGGVEKFVKKVGEYVKTFIGKIPAYVVTVRHSNQSVEFAMQQRAAELDKVRNIINRINSKRKEPFSAALSILGHGITGLTCTKHFPVPNSNTLITIVVADRRRTGKEGEANG